MLKRDAPPDVNTAETPCLKRDTRDRTQSYNGGFHAWPGLKGPSSPDGDLITHLHTVVFLICITHLHTIVVLCITRLHTVIVLISITHLHIVVVLINSGNLNLYNPPTYNSSPYLYDSSTYCCSPQLHTLVILTFTVRQLDPLAGIFLLSDFILKPVSSRIEIYFNNKK